MHFPLFRVVRNYWSEPGFLINTGNVSCLVILSSEGILLKNHTGGQWHTGHWRNILGGRTTACLHNAWLGSAREVAIKRRIIIRACLFNSAPQLLRDCKWGRIKASKQKRVREEWYYCLLKEWLLRESHQFLMEMQVLSWAWFVS